MRLSDFDYHLPPELIAQEPPATRDASRMLVVHRGRGEFEDRHFRDLPRYLGAGDCIVLNDSRVLPARLFGMTAGTRVEVLLLEPLTPDNLEWRALVRPGRRLGIGATVDFDAELTAEVIGREERGERVVRFSGKDAEDIYGAMERIGQVPLPPYIKREGRVEDRERYQTVYAKERGSVAAPTAGLHFTEASLQAVRGSGAAIAKVTLHVGLGTFQPLDHEDFEGHRLHSERYSISTQDWNRIETASRVIAVGTTSVRSIESAAATGIPAGSTDLFIYPGYTFRRTDCMLTNFHLPRTSLLLLVCALAGRELTLAAYQHAVSMKYRFFSYGDCMLIL